METEILVAIVVLTLSIGVCSIAAICMPSAQERRNKKFGAEVSVLCAQRQRRGKPRISAVKGQMVARLATLNAQKIIGQVRLQRSLRNSTAALQVQQILMRIHRNAIEMLDKLNLSEAEKAKYRAEIEEAIKAQLREL